MRAALGRERSAPGGIQSAPSCSLTLVPSRIVTARTTLAARGVARIHATGGNSPCGGLAVAGWYPCLLLPGAGEPDGAPPLRRTGEVREWDGDPRCAAGALRRRRATFR